MTTSTTTTRKKLSELFIFKNGHAFKKSEWSSKGLPIIRIQNLNNQNCGFNYYAGEYSDDILVQEGDLLFSWSGTVGSSFGPHIWQRGKGLLNQHIFIVSFKTEIDKRYAYYALEEITSEIEQQVNGSVGLVHITKAKLNNFTIPVPPLFEQQRIVDVLDRAFENIEKARAKVEMNLQNAQALFESQLHTIFTQRDNGWKEKTLGSICERITKGSSPKWQGIEYVDKPGILFVTSENVGEYRLLMEEPKFVEEKFNEKDKKSILRKGDVLTNIVGASIGRTAVFDLDEVANINQAVCLIRCEPSLLYNFYLTYLLNSPVFKKVLHENEVNNARANLSLGFFSQLAVPLPSISKQKEITAKLDELREETYRLKSIYKKKLLALDELKKSLLHQAFNGDL